MKKQLLLPFVLFLSVTTQAQMPFGKAITLTPSTFSIYPTSVSSCSNGGFIVSNGMYQAPHVEIALSDNSGQVQWIKSLSADSSSSLSVIQAGECIGGGYYVFGECDDTAGVPTSTSDVDYYITKLDPSGNVTWTNEYTTNSMSYGHPNIVQTSSGQFVISTSLWYKMEVIKTNSAGVVVSAFSFSSDSSESDKDPGFDCVMNSDGSMLLAGKSISDIALVKADANGQIQWSRDLTNGTSYYHANAVERTADGGYVVAGYQDQDGFVMKTDSSGNVLWYKAYASITSFDHVLVLPSGDVELLGYDIGGGNIYVRLSPAGLLINAYEANASVSFTSSGNAICSDATGALGVTGNCYNANSGNTIALIRTDASGNFPCVFSSQVVTIDSSSVSPSPVALPFYSRPETSVEHSRNFTVTADAFTQTDFCILFSTNDHPQNNFSLTAFPSPVASGQTLHLKTENFTGDAVISIYDVSGKMVKQVPHTFVSGNAETIDIPTQGLNSGIYFVRVTNEQDAVLGNTKFIVE